MRYLLAAEADKIQDFIFRSSRLREVVGASQLLSRFCRSVEDTLARGYGGDVVVNDGGSFRVIFEGDNAKQKAVSFGADLVELYRLSLGGSLSVAEPVEMNGNFRAANEDAGKKLRRAKSRRQGVVAEVHMPYVAFCASCGVALAIEHGRLEREPNDARPRYLCSSCQIKAIERATNRNDLLGEFLTAVIGDQSAVSDYECPSDADEVTRYDRRSYVAYLIADGNGMGQLFGKFDTPGRLRDFSSALTKAVRESLAVPTRLVRNHTTLLSSEDARLVPVLPLILGGDDLFALIPAPYSLDFARRFCLSWEDQLRQLVKTAGLTIGQGKDKVPCPTVAAAVVICKSKYPYALAHKRAEELLKEAKRHSKLLAAETGEHLSAVNFEVILGNRLAGQEEEDEERRKAVQATLRPYWVTGDTLSTSASERGIELKMLLDQRLALKNAPNKRLIELRGLFEDLPDQVKVQNRGQKLEKWSNRLEIPLKRSGKHTQPQLRVALAALGKPKDDGNGAHNWREVKRSNDTPLAHGMLDLLEVWDFAQDLDHDPDNYEPKEEDK